MEFYPGDYDLYFSDGRIYEAGTWCWSPDLPGKFFSCYTGEEI